MERKIWRVEYDHKDGRKGTVEVTTEVSEYGGFQYGNCKAGTLIADGYPNGYDLRYCHGDLHRVMLKQYFGAGLVSATEIHKRYLGQTVVANEETGNTDLYEREFDSKEEAVHWAKLNDGTVFDTETGEVICDMIDGYAEEEVRL